MFLLDLFDIPIYYISQNCFNDKWKNFKDDYINKMMRKGLSQIEAKNSFIYCNKIESLWNYNKIIGYIKLIYNNKTGDIEFEIYKSTKNKFIYNKKFMMTFDKIAFIGIAPNLHIYVKDKTNEEIIRLINDKLKYIYDEFFSKKNYVDTKAFNNICNYIDFKKMIDDYRK